MDILNQVMTTKEVSLVYHLSDQNIRKACKAGWIPARKSGSTWLILRDDAEKKWGYRNSPKEEVAA